MDPKGSALEIAVDQVDNINVLTHPILRRVTNVKWEKMGYVFYCELIAYGGLILSYFASIIIGDQDWIVLASDTAYALMVLRVVAWLCCLYLVVKVEFGEISAEGFDYFNSFWNWLNIMAYGSIFVTIPLELAGESSTPGHHALVSIINVSLWLNLLQYLCIHKSTGILINTMGRMVQDVRQFLVLYSIFLLGFSSALHSIMQGEAGYETYGDSLITVLLMLFGNLTYDPYNNATGWKWAFSNLMLFAYASCRGTVLAQ